MKSKLKFYFTFFLIFVFAFWLLKYLWEEKRWRYIVIHHSASDIGNLEYYKKLHQEEKGWDNIAYHFVINNGSMGTIPGQIEESELWKKRKSGYSTKNWLVNTFGISIVIVGNLEEHPPLPQQYEALLNLVFQLSKKYDIPPERIFGHREIQNTKCPGKHINMAKLRKEIEEMHKRQDNIR
ncbi:MAG: N-acetylmuramoyl-L-alanine amidase [Leptospiraceae bacterium]|nr:N-acetylmuramoyl-L-alanine amidase [Leptospiraceae bacterium]MDW7976288.1 peptidoglycan recognition family protein [Leptospiraceae bacterium]